MKINNKVAGTIIVLFCLGLGVIMNSNPNILLDTVDANLEIVKEASKVNLAARENDTVHTLGNYTYVVNIKLGTELIYRGYFYKTKDTVIHIPDSAREYFETKEIFEKFLSENIETLVYEQMNVANGKEWTFHSLNDEKIKRNLGIIIEDLWRGDEG